MYTLEKILQILRERKPELQKKYPISRLGIFGSYARGEATETSDIDIAVEITGPMGLNFIAMANEIEQILGTKSGRCTKKSYKTALPALCGKRHRVCLEEPHQSL